MEHFSKQAVADLAIFGGNMLFSKPRSTSNLVKPDFERFLEYSRTFYEARHFTNNGPLCRELERRLAEFHDTRYCVSFCSGFWALVLALRVLARPRCTEVLMPSLTYRRLGDVVSWAGLTPSFCDVDRHSLSLSPQAVEGRISENTALILAVNPIVNCCDAEGLERIAEQQNIPLLFDSVESVYESIAGRKVGSFGVAECFSLHASKLLNGFEGGYLTTNDERLAVRLSLMRGFGFHGPDNVEELGTNAKLNEIHAAMALASLDDLEAQINRNRERYRAYEVGLRNVEGVRLLEFDETEQTSYKNIVVEIEDSWPITRDQLITILNAENILARAYYSPPLHSKRNTYKVVTGQLPWTEKLAQRFALLPCGHFVSPAEIGEIVRLLRFLKIHGSEIKKTLPT